MFASDSRPSPQADILIANRSAFPQPRMAVTGTRAHRRRNDREPGHRRTLLGMRGHLVDSVVNGREAIERCLEAGMNAPEQLYAAVEAWGGARVDQETGGAIR